MSVLYNIYTVQCNPRSHEIRTVYTVYVFIISWTESILPAVSLTAVWIPHREIQPRGISQQHKYISPKFNSFQQLNINQSFFLWRQHYLTEFLQCNFSQSLYLDPRLELHFKIWYFLCTCKWHKELSSLKDLMNITMYTWVVTNLNNIRKYSQSLILWYYSN